MDFAKKNSSSKKTRKYKLSVTWVFIALSILTMCGFGFLIYKNLTVENGFLAKNINFATSWLTERSTNLQKKVAKAKPLTSVTKEEEQQIHFEFYSALPNEKLAAAQIDTAPEEETIPKQPVKKMIVTNAIFASPEELEKELSEKIRQTKKMPRNHPAATGAG